MSNGHPAARSAAADVRTHATGETALLTDHSPEEPELVRLAREAYAGRRSVQEVYAAFDEAVVYAQRTPRPGVFVTGVPNRGRWTVVFSQLERLAAHAGECDYLATTGADFLDLVPEGVGVMLDPDDEHRFPMLTRMASAQQIDQAWAHVAQRRGSVQVVETAANLAGRTGSVHGGN